MSGLGVRASGVWGLGRWGFLGSEGAADSYTYRAAIHRFIEVSADKCFKA